MDFRTSYRAITYNSGATWLAQRRRWWFPVWFTSSYAKSLHYSVPHTFSDTTAALAWCVAKAAPKKKGISPIQTVEFGRLP